MTVPNENFIGVDCIKLNIHGLVVELTVDQARQLFLQLSELFSPITTQPVIIQGGTVWIDPSHEPFPEHWEVSYSAHGNKSTLVLHG